MMQIIGDWIDFFGALFQHKLESAVKLDLSVQLYASIL